MAKPPKTMLDQPQTVTYGEGSEYPDPDGFIDRIDAIKKRQIAAARKWLAANPQAAFTDEDNIPGPGAASNDERWGLIYMLRHGSYTTDADRKRVRGLPLTSP